MSDNRIINGTAEEIPRGTSSAEWRPIMKQCVIPLPRKGWRGRLDLLVAAITGRRVYTEPVEVVVSAYVRAGVPVQIDVKHASMVQSGGAQ